MLSDQKISPYIGFGPLHLSMKRAKAHDLLSSPSLTNKNRFSPGCSDYWKHEGITINFDKNELAVEIGFGSGQKNAAIEGIMIFDPSRSYLSVYEQLCRIDGAPMTDVGFMVLFKLGITLAGFEDDDQDDRTVTVFSRGQWNESDPDLKVMTLK